MKLPHKLCAPHVAGSTQFATVHDVVATSSDRIHLCWLCWLHFQVCAPGWRCAERAKQCCTPDSTVCNGNCCSPGTLCYRDQCISRAALCGAFLCSPTQRCVGQSATSGICCEQDRVDCNGMCCGTGQQCINNRCTITMQPRGAR